MHVCVCVCVCVLCYWRLCTVYYQAVNDNTGIDSAERLFVLTGFSFACSEASSELEFCLKREFAL